MGQSDVFAGVGFSGLPNTYAPVAILTDVNKSCWHLIRRDEGDLAVGMLDFIITKTQPLTDGLKMFFSTRNGNIWDAQLNITLNVVSKVGL